MKNILIKLSIDKYNPFNSLRSRTNLLDSYFFVLVILVFLKNEKKNFIR